MAEDDLFSQLAVTVTKLQCKISQLENKCKNQINYQQELTSEFDKEREESKRLCKNIEDLESQQKLLTENIISIKKSKEAAEESYSDLNSQLALEVEKTRQMKIIHKEILENYTSRWEKYLEIYNSLPLAKEKTKLSFALKAKDIQVNLVKWKISEAKNKLNKLELIKEKMEQISVRKMAEKYKKYCFEVKKREQLLYKLREVKTQIEQVKLEKLSLLESTGNKIDAVKKRTDYPGFAWSYRGIKNISNSMEIGNKSCYSEAFQLQKLKIPEFKTTPPPTLNFSLCNNAKRRELRINNSPEKTLDTFNKQKTFMSSFMKKSNTQYNVIKCEVKDKHTTQEDPPKIFEKHPSFPNKQPPTDDKQNQIKGLPNSKPKNQEEDQEIYKLAPKLQLVDRKVTDSSQTKEKLNVKENTDLGEKISLNVKLIENTTAKQSNLPICQSEKSSVVISINSVLTNSKTQQIDCNTPLRSLLDKTNLKRQHENNNYCDSAALLSNIKTKYKPVNLSQTVNANQKTNVQKNQNEENIVFSYQSLSHDNILSELKSNNGTKLQKKYSEMTQQENKEESKEMLLKNCEDYPQMTKVQEEITGMIQSPPDLVLTQTTKVFSQGSNKVGSQEVLTPSDLDEAGRIVYMKIAAESPGYEYNPDSIMCMDPKINGLSLRSEPGEQSHYFMNSMSQNKQDESSRAYLANYGFSPPPGSYIMSPPGERLSTAEKSDNTYVLSPPGGQSFGGVNSTNSNPINTPLFGPKVGGDVQDKIERNKTEGISFSFSKNTSSSRPSIFNMF